MREMELFVKMEQLVREMEEAGYVFSRDRLFKVLIV